MNICIICSKIDDLYSRELNAAIALCGSSALVIQSIDLTTDFLLDNNIDVAISNQLDSHWLDRLKRLNIVTIIIGPLKQFHNRCDIVVDCAESINNKYFTGPQYSLVNNNFDILEIANLVHVLDFDSGFFGFPIAYITSKYLTKSIIYRLNNFLSSQSITLVEYLCNCHDDISVRIAEENAFHFTDIRMSLSKNIDTFKNADLPPDLEFHAATQEDIPYLREIGEGLYLDSRYYFDGHFPVEKISDFYKSWIEKGVLGTFDHFCFCLYSSTKPIGFCTVRFNTNSTARIGVFGISSKFQGKGLGSLLLNSVFNIAKRKGIRNFEVVTQGRNYPAQKLYQSVGFRVLSNELWYHKWIKS